MLDITWLLAALTLTVPAQAPPQAAAPAPERNPIIYIGHNLVEDLRDFPRLDTLVILGTGGLAATIAHNSDASVDRWTLDHPAGSWTKIGRVGGDGWTMGAAALGTWAIGKASGHATTTHVGNDLIRAQVLNAVTTRALKIAIDRRRPSGGGHAFPSGHTSASFASAGVLHRHFGWKGAVPGYAAAGFVALTRVRDRMHWLSDTVAGAALGISSAWTVTRGHKSDSTTITPVALPGGAGVVVRW